MSASRRTPRAFLIGIAACLFVWAPPTRVAAQSAGDIICRLALIDGSEAVGALIEITPERIRIEGRDRPLAYHELREIVFGASGEELAAGSDARRDDTEKRPLLQFVGGEALPARVLDCDGKILRFLVRGERTESAPSGETIGTLAVPVTALRAFRLREPHPTDRIFEETLKSPPPDRDMVFVRRGERLLRLECVFRAIDGEFVTIEYGGEERRIRRNRILGVILASVAGATIDSGDEGVLHLESGGRAPARIRGISFVTDGGVERPQLDVTVHGSPWPLRLDRIDHIAFASDRIRFLSELEPSKVTETPLFDNRFPYRRDLSVGGGPIWLDGVEYRKGLGVHSRSVIQYDLDGSFTSFVARVGIDDLVGGRGAATVRVIGNGRKLFESNVSGGEDAIDVVVPITGIRTLALETDYGEDGVDLGDHVDWADARLVRPAGKRVPATETEGTSR